METNETPAGTVVTVPPVMRRLAFALASAQGEFPDIERTRHVSVAGDKARYEFDYAPLDVILKATRPALSRYGLALVHDIDTVNPECVTVAAVLLHESGEERRVSMTFPFKYERVQQLGSLVTYLKRYATEAVLGVCAEQDDDGNAADGNGRQMSERKPAPAVKPAPVAAKPAPVTKSSHGQDRAEAAGTIAPKAETPRVTIVMPDATGPADVIELASAPFVPPTPVTAATVPPLAAPGETAVEYLLTEEQDAEIGGLFKARKMTRAAATKIVQDVTGKDPAHLLRPDAEKLIAHLRTLPVAS